MTGPLWDSAPDPGVQEAGDTRAVTVGPQIPHPVAPALVSWLRQGKRRGTWYQPGLGVLLGQGGGGSKHALGSRLLGRDFSSALSEVDTNRGY